MTKPRVITAATQYPVTVAEAIGSLRLDSLPDASADEAQNADVERMIREATERCESMSSKTWYQKTFEYCLDDFPDSGVAIVLPRATPLISVASIAYTDCDEIETVWPSTEYILDTYSEPGRILEAYNKSYPSFTPRPVNAVKIQYIAGTANTSPLEQMPLYRARAVLILVHHWWQNPEAGASNLAGQPLSPIVIAALSSILADDMQPNSY